MRALRLMNASPFSIKESTLPEYPASSSASIVPPLLSSPFPRVQNNRDQRIGLSKVLSSE